jgi:hypothetical protein
MVVCLLLMLVSLVVDRWSEVLFILILSTFRFFMLLRMNINPLLTLGVWGRVTSEAHYPFRLLASEGIHRIPPSSDRVRHGDFQILSADNF